MNEEQLNDYLAVREKRKKAAAAADAIMRLSGFELDPMPDLAQRIIDGLLTYDEAVAVCIKRARVMDAKLRCIVGKAGE
jgi:hypothetical protein